MDQNTNWITYFSDNSHVSAKVITQTAIWEQKTTYNWQKILTSLRDTVWLLKKIYHLMFHFLYSGLNRIVFDKNLFCPHYGAQFFFKNKFNLKSFNIKSTWQNIQGFPYFNTPLLCRLNHMQPHVYYVQRLYAKQPNWKHLSYLSLNWSS